MVMDEVKNQICNTKVAKSQALSPVKLHKVKGSCGQAESAGEGEGESPSGAEGVWSINKVEESLIPQPTTSSLKELRISQSHSKKVVKHALRQQAKRRRKNTTIASGNTAPISRIVMPPHELEEVTSRVNYKPPTMMEVLSSIPGFSIKQRKRSNKKLSAAAQLEQTKEGCIDLETPDSILVNTNLRSLLNKHTFNCLPTLYQHKLVQLLPQVDRAPPASDSFRLSASGLNNEFFARACLEWRERLSEGEFTPEHQQKLKTEAEREKSKLDPWKLKHFEPIWGESAMGSTSVVNHVDRTPPPAAPPKPKPAVKVKTPPAPAPPPRLRTVGAVTRAVANYREKREAEESTHLEPNKRVKSAGKSDVLEPPVTSEPSSMATATTSTTSQQSQTSPTYEILRPEVEETKEEVKCPVEKMEEDVDESKEVHFPEETSNKCTEVKVSEWENVEVKEDEPVHEEECEEQNTQSEECNATDESDNFKHVCDISTNKEEIKSKEETVPSEAIINEKHEETEIAQNNQENVELPERSVVAEELYVNENQLCVEHKATEEVNLDEQDNQISQEKLEETSVENNRDQPIQEPCSKSASSDVCNNESMEFEEEKNDSDSKEISNPTIQNVPNTIQPDEYQTVQNSPQPDTNHITEPEKENNINKLDETLPSEVEMINAQRFPEAEENLEDDRYEADINDSLEYVNEETSTSLQNCTDSQMNPELTNNQDSIDSQGKEDSCNYSVKMEEDLDINDTGSNMQSQDSQDTRLDEESNCQQDADLMIPDSEANMSGGDMSGSEYNMYSSVIYQEALKEDVETAALLAAWGAVGPGTEKLLAEVALQEEEEDTHVPVIPMQEDLDIRLEEIKSAPNGSEWQTYDKSSNLSEDSQATKPPSEQYGDHVKLELEVTLTPTPEVDSQVSSTMESGPTLPGTPNSNFSTGEEIVPSTSAAPVTVIPPTTFVCLPPSTPSCTVQTPMHLPPAQPGVVSSSAAVPYLALTTSTPVRAYPTKPKTSAVTTAGRSSRNVSTKPPPGAVNLERSYQICQAVIQNSPNRDQLRCQLKPPPSMLISTKDKTQYSVVTSSRGTKVLNKQRYQQRPTTPVVVKHVFTSSQGYPVTMAVLPQAQPTNPEVAEGQTGHYVLVQRAGTQVRRSNSAPPSNNENMVGVGGRGRPASVGEGGTGGDSYPAKQNMRSADCPCSLKAMIACKKCGAFCHDDCIDPPSRVCVTCLIR